MHTITDKKSLRELLNEVRQAGKTIGLVPTMGNLHSGHLELINTAKARADFVVCTIFVNPLQFGAGEDLDAYPRTLGEDMAKLSSVGCDSLFVPSVTEIYGNSPRAPHTTIQVPELTEKYCGASRPGHFEGVATIVCKLFNLVVPDTAYFGLKDYQQYLVIQKMIADLEFNVELVGVEIQRESTGLALSSRNQYLNDEQLQKGALLYHCLLDIEKRIKKGNRDFVVLEKMAAQRLEESGFSVDYFAICNAKTLTAATALDEELIILTAARLGQTRLIDNIRFSLKS